MIQYRGVEVVNIVQKGVSEMKHIMSRNLHIMCYHYVISPFCLCITVLSFSYYAKKIIMKRVQWGKKVIAYLRITILASNSLVACIYNNFT